MSSSYAKYNIDQQGLKNSYTQATDKVLQTRQSTLADFQIDLDTMTSNVLPEVDSDHTVINSPVQRIRKLSK